MVVDLTNSDDDEDYYRKRSNDSNNDSDSDIDDDNDNDNDDSAPVVSTFIALCHATIVGIRYYSGTAHPGEFVLLQREPHNPYDSNAIRIDNLQGEKVGHIKREQAAILAKFMDQYGSNNNNNNKNNNNNNNNNSSSNVILSLEGIISNYGNAYTLPLTIEFFVQTSSAATTEEDERDFERQAKALATKLQRSFRGQCAFTNHFIPPQATDDENVDDENGTVPTIESTRMNWSKQANELDAMFEEQSNQQLKNLPAITMPTALKTELFPYQQQGLQWLVHHDKTEKMPFYEQKKEKNGTIWHCSITNASQPNKPKAFRGGMLCDEQGLGKTLQMIGLMLANPPLVAGNGETKATANLIVCPVSVMSNWEQQMQHHTQDEDAQLFRIGFYQGSSRTNLLPKIASGEINVVLVSYHTLASEYTKVFGKPTNGNTKIDDCKPTATKKSKMTNYSIFHYDFHRIILDEAHTIRSTRSRFFHACSQISARSKWALTGTPFVNKPDDVYALLAFVGVEPLSDKQIYQRAITKPMQNGNDTGMACLRLAMAHVALRRSKATAKIKLAQKTVHLTKVSFEENSSHKTLYDALFGTVRVAFQAVLKGGDQQILQNYSSIFEKLLRLRQACCSAKLVPLERRLRTIEMWKELQQRSGDKSRPQLTAEEGLALLEKLKGAFVQDVGDALPECAVCLTEMEESQCIILRTCSHVYCEECIDRICSNRNPNCPLCRRPFIKSDIVKRDMASSAATKPQYSANNKRDVAMDNESIGTSPKIKALLQTIKTSMKADEKGVIFSQFTSFLDLIEEALKGEGHSFTRLDGSMAAHKRVEAIKRFSTEEATPRFILCSLHAAGTGLNLTRGSVAFMVSFLEVISITCVVAFNYI